MRLATAPPRLLSRLALPFIIVVQMASGVLFFTSVYRPLPQLVYRDVAAFFVDQLRYRLRSGRSEDEAYATTYGDLRRALPDSTVLTVDASGAVVRTDGACSPIAGRPGAAVDPTVLRALDGPALPDYPLRFPPLCGENRPVISAALMPAPGGARAILIAQALTHTLDLAKRPDVFSRIAVIAALPSLALLIWWPLMVRAFRRTLFSHVRIFTESAEEFAKGDLSKRFEATDLAEFGPLTQTFNVLADEVSRRLSTVSVEDAERQELMSGLAHDLRTPMTSLEGCIALLKSESLPAERRDRYEKLFAASLAAQEELARDLTELAAIGRLPDEARPPVDFSQLLDDAITLTSPIADSKGVNIVLSQGHTSRPLFGNYALLRRAVVNLLDNALRHTPERGDIEVSTADDRGRVQLTVTNMASSEPEAAASRPGLGLVIVRKIVEAHQGTLDTSRAANRFSVIVELPEQQTATHLDRTLIAATPLSTGPLRPAMRLRRASMLASILCVLTNFQSGPKVPAVLLLIAFCAEYLLRSRSTRVIATVVVLVALLHLGSQQSTGLLVALTGFAVFLSAAQLASLCSRKPLAPVASAVLVQLSSALLVAGSRVWLYLLGGLGAFWIVAVFYVLDRLSVARRAGIRLSGLLLVGTGLTVFAQALAIYVCSMSSLKSAIETQIGTMKSGYMYTLAVRGREHRSQEEELIHIFLFNPIISIATLTQDGEVRDWVGVGAFDDEQPFLKNAVAAFTRSGRNMSASIDRGFRRFLNLLAVGEGQAPYLLAIIGPGHIPDFIVHRQFTRATALLIPSQLVFAWLMLLFHGFGVSRTLKARIDTLQAGLERYRAGEYRTPIGLPAEDVIGRLGATIDTLAERIPALERTIQQRRERQRLLLTQSAAALRAELRRVAHETKALDSRQPGPNLAALSSATRELRNVIEDIFDITYLERGQQLAIPREEVSLAELVNEECERWSKAVKAPEPQTLPEESLRPVVAPPQPLIRAIRLFLQLCADRGSGELRVVASQNCTTRVSIYFVPAQNGADPSRSPPPPPEGSQPDREFALWLVEKKLSLLSIPLHITEETSGNKPDGSLHFCVEIHDTRLEPEEAFCV